ncbi:MAG TPA: DUF72 domain-containing protein [Tepidisphaeraceae bacterium]|nr:DUF72 domain-containing protein [Tepidisphaeraceae bacterium]
MPQTRIGISGWTYGPWRGVFYPKDLAHKRELEFASRQFNSIEINGSFYSLQRPSSYETWYDATPDDFVFSVKGGRFITHMKKLKDVDDALANFFASGLLKLKEKLGPILWQFPPGFGFNEERFAQFFEMLPTNTRDAAAIARKHTEKLEGRAWTKTDANRRVRHCVEIRHNSFKDERFVKLCRRHKIAIVLADTAGRWPYMEDVTADFIYARLHGDAELYVSGYTDSALDWWARRLEAWRCGSEPADALKISASNGRKCANRDVYVYFDNDAKVKAPFDARNLAARLTGAAPMPVPEDLLRKAGEPPRDRWAPLGRRKASTA